MSMINGKTITQILGVKNNTGPIMGVEIEIECDKDLPKYGEVFNPTSNKIDYINTPSNWKHIKDGSLRGHSMEYVLGVPKSCEKICEIFIPSLKTHLKDYIIDHKSPRVSTHVHMNISDLTYVQTINLAVLWWSLENFLVKQCGPSREGNNFCLRAKDATRLVSNLIKDVKEMYKASKFDIPVSPFVGNFSEHDSKYSALNLAKVGVLGTFEFRTFPGLDFNNTTPFENWMKQIEHLYFLCKSYENPEQIWKEFDSDVSSYAKKTLTDHFYNIFLSYPKEEREKLIQENEMFVASIAYCVPKWSVKCIKKKNKNKSLGTEDVYA